jgi:hypothetical protein
MQSGGENGLDYQRVVLFYTCLLIFFVDAYTINLKGSSGRYCHKEPVTMPNNLPLRDNNLYRHILLQLSTNMECFHLKEQLYNILSNYFARTSLLKPRLKQR